jgi:hypothetical protein
VRRGEGREGGKGGEGRRGDEMGEGRGGEGLLPAAGSVSSYTWSTPRTIASAALLSPPSVSIRFASFIRSFVSCRALPPIGRASSVFPAAYSAIVLLISDINSASVVGVAAEPPGSELVLDARAPALASGTFLVLVLALEVLVLAGFGSEGLKSFDLPRGLRGPNKRKRRGASAGPLERPLQPSSVNLLKTFTQGGGGARA